MRSRSGFTLIELITVMFIMTLLAGIALPQFKGSVIAAREAVLADSLYQLRDLIDQYQLDKGRYPASLEALVEDGYLRALPKDPMTGAPDWIVELSEFDASDPGGEQGVYDVHSASTATGLNGTPYSEW